MKGRKNIVFMILLLKAF